MRKILFGMAAAMAPWAASAAVITVTSPSDSHVAGKTNLSEAILALNDGDTIAFNISGAGPHYLIAPAGGFPVITKKNVTVDGYTQTGAKANTNPITAANNAVIKIVLDCRNGNVRDMGYTAFTPENSSPPMDNTYMADERGGYSPGGEFAILGLYRASGANIRGLAFLSSLPTDGNSWYGIAIAHDYGHQTAVLGVTEYTEGSDANTHINGNWFGVDPGNPTPAGITECQVWIAHYRHRDKSTGGTRPELPNIGLTCGVAKGSADPRAEFNVFVGSAYVMDGENIRSRASGNFFGVLPDGVTPIDMSVVDPGNWVGHFEWGRYDDSEPMIIGTDGDGVNDADEGNLFGPVRDGSPTFDFYGTGNKTYIIAGNTWGMGVNGVRWTNSINVVSDFRQDSGTKVRFGTDFNGVSDELEGNKVYNNWPIADIFGDPNGGVAPNFISGRKHARTDAWISVRGNTAVGCFPGPIAPTESFFYDYWVNYTDTNFVNSAYVSALDKAPIPELLTTSTKSRLAGKIGAPKAAFPKVVVDVYLPDDEGIVNGAKFNYPEFGGTSGWGFVNGKTYLGSFTDNSAADSNPAVGEFDFDISSLNLAAGTKVTVAVNFLNDTDIHIDSVTRGGGAVTIAWSGGNPNYQVQKASAVTGPWTRAAVTTGKTLVVPEGAGTTFFRVTGGSSGQTSLCAIPVALKP